MTLRHARRLCIALVALFVAAVSITGCSKSPAKPSPPKPIPQTDADDIAQLVATTMSADNGGWFLSIKVMAETLSTALPVVLSRAPAKGSRWVAPMSGGLRTQNDFHFPDGGLITYFFEVGWVQDNQTIVAARDSFTEEMAAQVSVDNGVFQNANGLDGTYGFHTYGLNQSVDSTFFALNLGPTNGDTIEFNGLADDSCFAIVHSTITPNAGRYWFHENFVDWTLLIPKPNLVTAPYPVAGSEVLWTIEARGLSTPARDDFGVDYIIEANMVFDGSPDAILTIANVIIEPDWAYHYKVNINTGHIQRID